MLWERFDGARARPDLGRAAGARQPGRARPPRARRREGRPRRRRPAADARDRRDLLRHLEARRDPALDVGPLRRRRHPPPPRRLRAEDPRHRRRQRAALRRRSRRRDPDPRRGSPRRRARPTHICEDTSADDPGAALLHVRHHRQGEGHRPRPPLHPRPRGVRLLPRRPARRALPRHGRVGVGRRDQPAARAVAARRRPVRLPARGRLRPGQQLDFLSRHERHQRLHDPDRDAGDDGDRGRGGAVPAAVPDRLQRRRAAQPRGDPLVPRAVRDHRPRLLRADRVLPALRQLPVHGGPRGLDGQADARLGRPDPRRGREPGRPRRARRDLPARPLEPALPARLLADAGGERGDLRRRLVPLPRRRDAWTRTDTSGTRAAPTT